MTEPETPCTPETYGRQIDRGRKVPRRPTLEEMDMDWTVCGRSLDGDSNE